SQRFEVLVLACGGVDDGRNALANLGVRAAVRRKRKRSARTASTVAAQKLRLQYRDIVWLLSAVPAKAAAAAACSARPAPTEAAQARPRPSPTRIRARWKSRGQASGSTARQPQRKDGTGRW